MGHRVTLNETCDVVVIGGGIVGSATAYFLATKGFSVMLIEKNMGPYPETRSRISTSQRDQQNASPTAGRA